MPKTKVLENKGTESSLEIIQKDDQLWTTSLDVAEKFGKRHDHVLEAIRELECPDNFRLPNFRESSYKNEQNKDQPMYLISRDGFSILAMGFTGKEAIQWKIKYLAAFNQMEKTIESLRELLIQKERQVNREWKQFREDSKVARRTATDAWQIFCNYAEDSGSKNPKRYYQHGTNLTYDLCIDGGHQEIQRRQKELKKKNGRDVLTLDEAVKVAIVESTIAKPIINEILNSRGEYHDLYDQIKDKYLQYRQILGQRLSLNGDLNPKLN